ncbi:membrane protein required for colicin V production [Mangrovibacterium marinum]|uniref:Membrane protein required for colicin V production n=1 Tax=Mangrovibacterium marinum TaxID=1639118 RepID=A0A2T5BX53_9BACT|nr:CvpA family protein [Mangrovibacterium marinum]PTN04250.1 membrane protein required for colicin V production [Mangrovibacterium marinum]
MNYIDLVLGILLLVAAVRGFIKGFVIELASLAALILGIWGAIHFSHFTAGFITNSFNWNSEYVGLVAFIVTLLVIVVLVHLIGRLLTKVVEAMALGVLNHLAGMLFGVLKAALILSVVLVLFDHVDKDVHILSEESKEESQVYEPLKNLVPTLMPFLNFWDAVNDEPNQRKTNESKRMV